MRNLKANKTVDTFCNFVVNAYNERCNLPEHNHRIGEGGFISHETRAHIKDHAFQCTDEIKATLADLPTRMRKEADLQLVNVRTVGAIFALRDGADEIERLRAALTEIETIAANDRGSSIGAIIAVCQMENK